MDFPIDWYLQMKVPFIYLKTLNRDPNLIGNPEQQYINTKTN